MLRRFSALLMALTLFVPCAFSSPRSSGHSHAYSRSSAGSRPYYGGGHHTSSHGGSYGVSGSSHRGGHYTSATGSHHYGRHK